MVRETSYNLNDLNEYISVNEPLLSPDQRAAYNAMLDRINREASGIIFLDAPGRTGKRFVIDLLLAKIRQHFKIAIAVASKSAGEAKVLQECKLIVWDECTMAHRRA